MFYRSNLALNALNKFKSLVNNDSESEFEIPAQVFRQQSLLKRHFKKLLLYACRIIEAKSLLCIILERKHHNLLQYGYDEFIDYQR